MRRLVFLIMALIALPSLAAAQASQFVPRILDYYGELVVEGRYENNSNKVEGGRETKATDTVLVEKINLYTLGYVYHPNFITLRLNLSGGLRQERYESTFSDDLSDNSTIDEYDFRMFVLPEHPYHLELYTVRRTPLTRAALNGINPVSTSYGAILTYDQKPYGASLSYGHQNTEAGSNSNDSDIYSARGIWFIGPFVTSAGYQHIDTDSSLQQSTSRDYSYFKNTFEAKNLRLESTVDLTEQHQEGSHAESFDTRSFQWQERLDQKLPWNFEAALYNLYLDDKTTTGNAPENEVTSRETRLEISHQLYASLRSRYAISYAVTEYPQGETKTTTNSLNFAYIKRIPFGIMRAGADLRYTEMDRTGQPVITNELHTATVPAGLDNTFTLNSPGAEQSSIVITVTTVVPPGDVPSFVELQQGLDYTVAPGGNTFLITVLSVPIGVCQTVACLDPTFVYTFRVTYSVVSEDLKLNTTEYGFNVRFELFNSLLSPYFSYYRTKQDQVSGDFIGVPADDTNTTVGLQVQRLPFIWMIEYEDLESNVNPSRTLRSELDYRKNITSSVSVFGRLNYSNTDYPMGQFGTTEGYTETIYGADLRVQKIFFSPRMAITLGGAYTLNDGLSRSETYALNGGLSLRMGRTDVIFTGRANYTNVEGVRTDQELTSELFYLTVRRSIF